MSNNAAERELRAVAVGRRNAGSDEGGRRAAAIYTLIATAKLSNVDPQAWLADLLARLPDQPAKRIHELLPLELAPAQHVDIEYRLGEGQYDRLPVLAADLVRRRVTVLAVFGGVHTALAAKAATATIPIVFAIGSDPVKFGLVASFNRPGGNVTGVSFFTAELEAKRLGLLHELVPQVTAIAALVNPANANAENQSRELKEAARMVGLQVDILHASSERDFDAAFATFAQLRAGALLVASDPFFFIRREKLVSLAMAQGVLAIYEWREFAEAGGLVSYGTNLTDAFRQAGLYTGRILKGEKPADLPIQQSTEIELIINLKTAQALGLTFPITLFANEVIE
jgi:putative ABC transport system substrate-binding protein